MKSSLTIRTVSRRKVRLVQISSVGSIGGMRELMTEVPPRNIWNLYEHICKDSQTLGICEILLGNQREAEVTFFEGAKAGKMAFRSARDWDRTDASIWNYFFVIDVIQLGLAAREFDWTAAFNASGPVRRVEKPVDVHWRYWRELVKAVAGQGAEEQSRDLVCTPEEFDRLDDPHAERFYLELCAAADAISALDKQSLDRHTEVALREYRKFVRQDVSSWVCMPVLALLELARSHGMAVDVAQATLVRVVG